MSESFLGTAADIPDEFKTVLARLYEFLHAHEVTRDLFLSALKSAGFSIAPSTLDRWVAQTNTIGSAISENKNSGNDLQLSREETRCLVWDGSS